MNVNFRTIEHDGSTRKVCMYDRASGDLISTFRPRPTQTAGMLKNDMELYPENYGYDGNKMFLRVLTD